MYEIDKDLHQLFTLVNYFADLSPSNMVTKIIKNHPLTSNSPFQTIERQCVINSPSGIDLNKSIATKHTLEPNACLLTKCRDLRVDFIEFFREKYQNV